MKKAREVLNRSEKRADLLETTLCCLSYFFPFWIFMLFFTGRSRRIHFHVSAAINLSATTLLYFMAAGILGFSVNLISWRWSFLSGGLSIFVGALYLFLGALGVFRVIKRNNRPLPFVIRFVII